MPIFWPRSPKFMNTIPTQMDPNKTVMVLKSKGKEVGRIAATASNAQAYVKETGRHYGTLEIVYERDDDAWLYAALTR